LAIGHTPFPVSPAGIALRPVNGNQGRIQALSAVDSGPWPSAGSGFVEGLEADHNVEIS